MAFFQILNYILDLKDTKPRSTIITRKVFINRHIAQ